MSRRKKKSRSSNRHRSRRQSTRRQSTPPPARTTNDFEVSIPNEYFHEVKIDVFFEAEKPTDDILKKEPWYFGTGFFYRVDGQDFLVTARHIFSARTWRENKWREDHQLAPNYIRIGVRGKTADGVFNADSLPVYDIVLPLLDDDENPLWLEHPTRRQHVDVAALPLAGLINTDSFHYLPIEPEPPLKEPRFWVTQDVFVVGYPLGLGHGYLWPLWIRGTVASEPALYFTFKEDEYPLFLVDARTRSGQSGSPVFLMRRHFAQDSRDHELPRSRFVGVYSGRANDEAATPSNPLPADLGFVWHAGEVDRICKGKTRAKKDGQA